MRTWLTLLLCIIISTVNASKTDSLRTLLAGLPDNHQKLEVLHELWKTCAKDSIEKALYYAGEERELALSLNNDKWLAKSYFAIGYLNKKRGYLGKAVANYVYAIELFKSLNDFSQLSSAYYNLANLFLIAEDFGNAKLYYEQTLRIRIHEKIDKSFSWVYHGIGEACVGLEMYDEAIVAYSSALDEAKKDDDYYTINVLYNTIGVLFQRRQMYDFARDNFYKSIVDETIVEDLAIAYNNIGETYLEEADYTKSKEYFSRALELKKNLDDDRSKVITLVNFGKLYINLQDYASAKSYLNNAVELASLSAIDRGAMEALDLLNEIHNIQAANEIYPSGRDMLKYENVRTAQMRLLSNLNGELAPLKNRYLLQVNYEVPMLSTQLSQAINSKNINKMLAAIAAGMSLIAIVFMAYYMRKVFTARRMLSNL